MVRRLDSGMSARRRAPASGGEDPSASLAVPADLTTVGDVLGWVGDDAGRAELALALENTKERPRKTLTEPLAAIILDA